MHNFHKTDTSPNQDDDVLCESTVTTLPAQGEIEAGSLRGCLSCFGFVHLFVYFGFGEFGTHSKQGL